MCRTAWFVLLPSALSCSLAGCGEVPPASPDAASADGPAAAACDLSRPFGVPQQVAGLNSTSIDSSVSFSPDELTAYLSSNRGGDFNLYTATRTSLSAPFGALAPLPAINTASDEVGASASADGKSLVFVRYDPTANLFLSTRGTDGVFTAAAPLTEVNSVDNGELDPRLSPDGLTLYYATRGAATLDLYVARRSSLSTTFAAGAPIEELNQQGVDEGSPFVTADGRTILYTRYTNEGNVWTATRSAPNERFGASTPVPGADGYVQWLSGDGCRLYVIQKVGQDDHIFMQARPK